jgi:hypothetical protein
VRRRIIILIALALLTFAALLLYGHARSHPEDVPWTALDLGQPIGVFTGRKLAGLSGEAPRCIGLLARAGIRFSVLPGRAEGAQCGYSHAIRFAPGGAVTIGYRPADVATSCAVAAALALWEWHVVEPAARRHFGQPVASIQHFGSYSCRRINGRAAMSRFGSPRDPKPCPGDMATCSSWSEHATANVIGIAGFTLADATNVSVASDWNGGGARAAFLREVRDGACRLFSTVLSPDYNAAHYNHLHLDQASSGAWGWRACR